MTSQRRTRLVVGCFAAVVAGMWLVSFRTATSARSMSREELELRFQSDIRNLVYRWSPEDDRAPAERFAALFSFVHQTYETTAWVPQSLFDNNLVAQVVAGDVETIVRDKVGLVLWPENDSIPAYGMAPNLSTTAPLSWTVN